MVDAIIVNVDKRSISSLNRRLGRLGRLPNFGSDAMYEWGSILQRDMISSARQVLTDWGGGRYGSGLNERGIRWEQRRHGKIGKLWMRQYLYFQDTMSPHYVPIRRGSLIERWTKDKFLTLRKRTYGKSFVTIDSKGNLKGAISVKKHKFIQRGYKRARPKLNSIIKRYVRMGIRG